MVQRPEDMARRIIQDSLYMVLATADETGRPWSSPVYFANAGYTVEKSALAHSRRLLSACDPARRPVTCPAEGPWSTP